MKKYPQFPSPLSDHDHPAVRETLRALAVDGPTQLALLERIFTFVRDEIRFGFPPEWDAVRASETLALRRGYCNTKATLFLALCRAGGIPARIHTGAIDLAIMRGIFPAVAFWLLPRAGGHSWIEVRVEEQWNPLDSYINDQPFFEQALKRLEASGWQTGFSISQAKGPASPQFRLDGTGFVHAGAVVQDHGTWNDFSEYMASDQYVQMTPIQRVGYPLLAWMANRKVEQIRRQQEAGV